MKKILKKILNNNTKFYAFASYLYNWNKMHWQPLKYGDLNKLLIIYTTLNDKVNFIQVGSNDGVSNDPLFEFANKKNWAGYCIEPIPLNFQKLKNNYSHTPEIKLLNLAIGEDGYLTMYYIDPIKAKFFNIDLPEWYNQLASFNRDLVVSDINGINRYQILESINVKAISFNTSIEKYNISKVDLLHIDTEGADWSILSSFPFIKLMPDVIIFEHNHISLNDYKKAVHFLRKEGYLLLKVNTDTFAAKNIFLNAYKNELEKACKY